MGRDSESHLLDTPENRRLLISIVSDKRNFFLTDQYGSSWYTKILPDGSEIWVSCRDKIIRNAGKNEVPRFSHRKMI